MCHEFTALPPHPPLEGGATDSEDLVLTSADGTKFTAFAARSESPTGAGIVVMPDVRGLFRFYEELALRFAEQGVNSVAIDYFGRTAGLGKRDESFPFMDHVRQTNRHAIAADVGAAATYLRSAAGGSCTSMFSVGFCFGGGQSWLQSTAGHGLDGVIGFYGRPGPGADGAPGPTQRAADFTCPVLMLMGGADQGIPREQVDDFASALKAAGVDHEVHIFPGAPHSFFDRSFEEHAEAAAGAWTRALSFIEARQKAGAASG